MLDLPVWYGKDELNWAYAQNRYFILPYFRNLQNDEYPPEPDEYRSYFSRTGWVKRFRSSYIGGNSNRVIYRGRHVPLSEIVSEIEVRIESIKTYRIQIDNILVPISGDLVLDAFTENLPLNGDLLHEAHLMLEFISGWDRRRNFKEFRERIRRE